MDDETPWFAPGHAASVRARPCRPRPRERLWTLVKGGKRIDAELLFHAENGVEAQFLHEGVLTYALRFVVRVDAVEEAEVHRARLLRQGWAPPVTSHPAEEGAH